MRVAVLGAGLQGVCIALELARRGVDVLLVDQDSAPLNRASLRNEGKVHLGLVYANDPTLATAKSMLDGALSFGPLLERWTGSAFASLACSHPFHYLVAHDSLLTPDQLSAHYDAVETCYRARLKDAPALHYLGIRPERLYRRLDAAELSAVASPRLVTAGFATPELALDLPEMANLLRGVLSMRAGIRFYGGRRVLHVERCGSSFRVEGTAEGGTWSVTCDQVVNALWEGRLAIDATLGLRAERPWIHRLKYRVLFELPAALRGHPSATIVLGAYGDVVVYRKALGYLSWYPDCMRGWSTELSVPPEWDAACRGEVPADQAEELARRALRAADAWYPGLAEARPVAVDAGVIFAWGDTDISDRHSGLHKRDETGVQSTDGYHSVNTGKLTTAPLHAVDAADAVMAAAARLP